MERRDASLILWFCVVKLLIRNSQEVSIKNGSLHCKAWYLKQECFVTLNINAVSCMNSACKRR